MKATSEPGLVELRMSVRAHVGKIAPALPGKYIKFMLAKPADDFLVPDPAPAASSTNRGPFVLMHMPKPRTRVVVPQPTTAVDVAHTPVDAPSTETLSAPSDATPGRPESPDEVSGFIERLSLPGAASNSDGGTGTGEGGGGDRDIALAMQAVTLKDSCCAHCGKQGVALQRCSACKQTWYCGAKCQNAGWKGHRKACATLATPLKDVATKVWAASDASDWRELLKWEGRLAELLVPLPDDASEHLVRQFSTAHRAELGKSGVTISTEHLLSVGRLEAQRVELLGKMQRFRDQSDAMCECAETLLVLKRRAEAAKYFQRARDVGRAHGFFSAECSACMGLGQQAVSAGRHEEGLEFLRLALVYPTPYP